MLPLSIVKGNGLSGATFFFSEYKYKKEAGSSPGGSTTSCNQKSLTANYQIERSDDRMCSDLINQGEGTSFLSYPLFCLLAWLLGSTTLYRSGFFFLYDPCVCHRSVSTLVQKREPIDVDSIIKLRAHRTKTQRTADYRSVFLLESITSRATCFNVESVLAGLRAI